MHEVEFAREDGWMPRVLRQDGGLVLGVVGGAGPLHDPREFGIPIGEAHLAVLRADLARHLILWSALMPLCDAAGTGGPIDDAAATALIDAILLGSPGEVDALLSSVRWDRRVLVAPGANTDLLDRGRVVAALRKATETADRDRAERDAAVRRRARRGVTLSRLDTAILEFTGQYLYGATIPRRNPGAVAPELLPEVMRVIRTAERASAGLAIGRGAGGDAREADRQDWRRMETAVESAVRTAHRGLADAAVRTVAFLMCSEAADRSRPRA